MPKSAPRKKGSPRPAAGDYESKVSGEAATTSRRANLSGAPLPFGDPLSGVVLVAEPPASAAANDALRRSLAAVGLGRAYVVWPTPDLLETLLSLEPSALAAVGPDAARAIDSSGYPLVKSTFSDAPQGTWFSWTKGTLGLQLPALVPALTDDDAKRRFWRAFRALRALAPEATAPTGALRS